MRNNVHYPAPQGGRWKMLDLLYKCFILKFKMDGLMRSTKILRAKKLRKNMSETEKKFWYRINNNQLGVKFRRQQPIGPYFVDFICFSLKLVIELDGEQRSETFEYDNQRTKYIESQGYRLIRIPNSWLVGDGIDDVICSLQRCINENLNVFEYFMSRYV